MLVCITGFYCDMQEKNMAIKIVTDSTCDIFAAEARDLDIHILPLHVRFEIQNFSTVLL